MKTSTHGLKRMACGDGALLGREILIDRITDAYFSDDPDSGLIGLLGNINNISHDVLDVAVDSAVSGAYGEPWKKLVPRLRMFGLGLPDHVARQFDVEIVSAAEPQGGGEVDGLRTEQGGG